MRWNVLAGVVIVLAFSIPASASAAQAASPGLDGSCQTIERKEYKDLRKLIDIDLETATDTEVRLRANQIMSAARAESLPELPDEIQKALDGSTDGLRTFLKTGMEKVWSDDLLILVTQTMNGAGRHVKEAAGKVLDEGTAEAALAYLNNGLYAARELDCQESQPSPSASPSAPVVLPRTGADTFTLVLGSAILIAFGIGAVVLSRSDRHRFSKRPSA